MHSQTHNHTSHKHRFSHTHSGQKGLDTKALYEVICWYVWYAPLIRSFHNFSHKQHIRTLTTQVHNSASWHPAQACWYFRGVCFSVLRFQPNTLGKAKPQQHYKDSYISQPPSHLPGTHAHTHTHRHTHNTSLLFLKKTAKGSNTARLHEGSVRGQLSAGWLPGD